jgi:PTH1 family peptidyl-tRNA hydrolase
MFIILGLGNPGKKYQKTRHNLGFMVLDNLSVRLSKQFKKGKGHFNIIETSIHSHRVFLIKPTTYMNRCGLVVGEILKKTVMELSHFLVLCDDLNISLGKLRLRKKGSDGGHKGLASIIQTLGTDQFPRLRLGIGNNQQMDATDYVLSPFLISEMVFVKRMIEESSQAAVDFIKKGIDWTMNFYNQ